MGGRDWQEHKPGRAHGEARKRLSASTKQTPVFHLQSSHVAWRDMINICFINAVLNIVPA